MAKAYVLIKDARIITGADNTARSGDILLKRKQKSAAGEILRIAPEIGADALSALGVSSGCEVSPRTRLACLRRFTDMALSFREPGETEKETVFYRDTSAVAALRLG